MIPKKVKVINIGCKSNYFDSINIENQFNNNDFQILNPTKKLEEEKADIFIVNSCTVTHKADRDSLNVVKKIKRLYPKSSIVFTGCMAQVADEKLKDRNDIDLIIGNTKKFQINKLLISHEKVHVDNEWELTFKNTPLTYQDRTRAFLKIQDGCNSRCSYCIINRARGPERSDTIENVVNSLKVYSANSFKEINLTGIRVGRFGFTNNESLLELLKRIENDNEITLRIRLGSLYPDEITIELLEFIKSSKKICHHFHISLQSADDSVLKSMNRTYSVKLFIDTVQNIRKLLPNSFIGLDVISGFPTETDEFFNNTYNVLNELPISDIHVFSYSKRNFTASATMSRVIPPNIIKDRVKKLKDLALTKKHDFFNNFIGKTYFMLPENNFYKKDDFLSGFTQNYLPVKINFNKKLINEIIPVKLINFEKCFFNGELLNA